MKSPEQFEFAVEVGHERLDKYLTERLPDLSRSRIQRLIEDGRVRLNGGPAKAGARLDAGDQVTVEVPPPAPLDLTPEANVPFRILYEDEHLAVVDKPAGVVVHPAPGHASGTLVQGLLARLGELPGIGGVQRPGIVHRLDKGTSGLLIVAKSEATHRGLTAQLKNHQIEKRYLTLVEGHVGSPEASIDAPIGRDPRRRQQMAVVDTGRPAITRYRVLTRLRHRTLVEAFPVTGRTHQIRVHFAAIGHPVVGDRVYGRPDPHLDRHFLHAAGLRFRHPVTGESLAFESALPAELQAEIDRSSG